jgi:mitochondrial fission protein ELM1
MVSCWGITDGSAGMVAQVKALAQAMQVQPEMKKIALHPRFAWQPNAMYAAGFQHYILDYALDKSKSDALPTPWPELVISCGRKGALIAMGMRHAAGAGTGTEFIHIQDPQAPARNFDLVIAMEHDKITGPNVIKTRFALHSITLEALAAAKAAFEPRFAGYHKPLIAVLIGGSTNKYTLSKNAMKHVIDSLRKLLANTPRSLLITASRRTGIDNIAALQQAFAGNPRVYIYDGKSENPYVGLLALADYIVVTNDSVNMMSEAHATGKPIYILPLPGHKRTKPARFAERLVGENIARFLTADLEHWTYPVNDEMQHIAAQIRERVGIT